MKLIDIPKSGEFKNEIILDDFLREVVEATVSHYERIGFAQPWIGYVGLENTIPVGVCGFKSQPVSGRVEIAYATLPAHIGRGIATALARELGAAFVACIKVCCPARPGNWCQRCGRRATDSGKGVATALAGELVRVARDEEASLTVFAQTLPEENASTSILKKLGFRNDAHGRSSRRRVGLGVGASG